MIKKNQIKKVIFPLLKDMGKLLMANLVRKKRVSKKEHNSLVSEVDILVNKKIVETIQKNFPKHHIMTEESGLIIGSSDYTWIVDPIDGTVNYIHKIQPFRIGIALVKKEELIFSSVSDPENSRIYYAFAGEGAFVLEKCGKKTRLSVSPNKSLKKCILMTHVSASNVDARARTLMSLCGLFTGFQQLRIYGSGLASMVQVARGKFDVYFNVHSNIWDILPAALIVREAGGAVTDLEGKEINMNSTSVLATNGHTHKKMLEFLKNI